MRKKLDLTRQTIHSIKIYCPVDEMGGEAFEWLRSYVENANIAASRRDQICSSHRREFQGFLLDILLQDLFFFLIGKGEKFFILYDDCELHRVETGLM